MYKFEILDLEQINIHEYENNYNEKNLFCTVQWLRFLSEFRNVKPMVIRIFDNTNSLIGHLTGASFSKFGLHFFGSPFYGWMGLHMGFDFIDFPQNKYHEVLDSVIDYLQEQLNLSYLIIADYKISLDIIKNCKKKLFCEKKAWTYFLDIQKSEEEIFNSFKSGYRTCVRKFYKMGGSIVEDYSDEFIAEHNRQLKDVFRRKALTAPDYSNRMKILNTKYPNMVLFIKAIDNRGNNIASSYYLGSGTMAFFASNASCSKGLNYNANQALMWYAIKYWKGKGIKTLDLGGTGDYKANFGSELKSTPIIVWSKHKWHYRLIELLRSIYYMQFRVKHRVQSIFSKKSLLNHLDN